MINFDEVMPNLPDEEVVVHIYSYYDTLLKQFNNPYVTPDGPALMAQNCKNSIIKGQFKAQQGLDLILVYLGTFVPATGEFMLQEKPKELLDIDYLCKFVLKQKAEEAEKAAQEVVKNG